MRVLSPIVVYRPVPVRPEYIGIPKNDDVSPKLDALSWGKLSTTRTGTSPAISSENKAVDSKEGLGRFSFLTVFPLLKFSDSMKGN